MKKTDAQREDIARWLAATDIGYFELHTPFETLRFGAPPDRPAATTLRAASVGVFRHAHPLHAAPLAPIGAPVPAGQAVGVLQIGPLLLPVFAPVAGQVARWLADDGAAVGFGAALIEFQTN
ncbi:acetyl-CoA carboxylase biotin carboxyl carrier protein subunit [Variovorax sp. J22P271]|uniref:acetyl-CoA carboxylase biotin carboxyl carrier protein n=1 Tax=Variovorax davisae TaxID=3053515 RepID=UPI0025776BED|nr:acetyl-CoA carboxylase biotin carboxyl carrier protein subunit [Variovorax sp. J22P271]MDM0035790.1 acetyl-CoA carboxylase biotin carboxyl carrier protein subunit [Variovorax sp. J22P271]